VGDAFLFTTNSRLSYLLGEQIVHIAQFDQPMYLLGYLARDGRVYLCDKDVAVSSYALSTTVVEFETLVLRHDLEGARGLLEDIPADQMNKIARFLEAQGHKEFALEVATDPEHRFELALDLNNLSMALEIAKEADAPAKWSVLGDRALAAWQLQLAEEAFVRAKDLGSLLLLYSSSGNKAGLAKLAQQAEEAGSNNIAFASHWSMGDVDAVVDLLKRTGRVSEAVLFSQTYKPSTTQKLVLEWKEALDKEGKGKVSRLLGVPGQDEDLFPEWDEYIKLEQEGSGAKLVEVNGTEASPETNGFGNEAAEAAAEATANGEEAAGGGA